MINDIDIILNTNFSACISTFRECSKDDHDKKNVVFFVRDCSQCFNFDKIKLNLGYDQNIKSADSIFVSRRLNSMYLIEFKNKNLYLDKSLRGVGKKGSDSLFVLQKMCNKKLAFTKNENCVYCCVFSTYNADIETLFLIKAIKNSNLEEVNLLDYSERVKSRVETKIKADYPGIGFLYTRICVLLEDHFSGFIYSIK